MKYIEHTFKMKQRRHKPDDCQPLNEAVERGEVSLVARVRGQYPGSPLKPGQLPGLRTVGYWDAVGQQGWGLPPHRNEGIEICYLMNGETYFATDHEEWMLRPGDITITRPWQRHRLGNPTIRACKLFWVILDIESGPGRAAWAFPSWVGPDAESRRELLRIYRKNQRCHLVDEGRTLKQFMERACAQLADEGPLVTAHLSDLINHLLLHVANQLSGGMPDSTGDPEGFNRSIREFFHGLEASIDKASEPWTVADMAQACRVGVTYLTASCRELFNATPSEQLSRIRLSYAAQLLREDTDLPVTDIAFKVGFSSSQYFATCFRRHYGATPLQYRQGA